VADERELDPAVQPPPINADAGRLKSWVEGGINYTNRLRCGDASRWRRAELYDDGRQWLRRAATDSDAPGQYSQWMEANLDPNSPDWIPTPVINEGRGTLSNEAAQLAKPNYRPTVIAKEDTLEARLGSKAAIDLLKWRLREMDWPGQSQLFYYRMPLHGGVWLKSEWVKSWDKTSPAPEQNAVSCAQHKVKGGSCDFVLNSPMIDAEQAQGFGMAENVMRQVPAQEDGASKFQVFACPTCENHPPLAKYKPTMDEAYQGKDSVGRPLGRHLPIGDWQLTVPSPFDMFPRDLGFNMNPLNVDEWTEAHVETLDWVALRYPEKAGQVKPENPAKLAEWHPVLGSLGMYGGYDSKLFRNSTRIKERHKQPWMEKQEDGSYKMNQGRSAAMAGDVVLTDGPLMIQSLTKPGEWMPQTLVVFVPWEFLDGGRRLSGFGIWDLMFDPQDGLNECVSQQQNIRQRCAVPYVLASRAHNLESPANNTGIAGRFVVYDTDPLSPDSPPVLTNNETAPPGIRDEAAFYRDEIGRLPGRATVERGEAPSNQVSAAAAIENLKTYVSETRQPRLERIKSAFKKTWSHGLQLMAGLYLEPRPVRIEDEDGEERWKMLQGRDLKNQTDVEVEADPDYDTADRNRALTNEFIDRKVIDPSDPRMARIISKIFDAPPELFEKQNLQEEQAQREWIAFRDQGKMPVVDPVLDDPSIHRDAHAKSATTERFRNMAADAKWREEVLPVIEPIWGQLKQAAQMLPAQPVMPDPSGMTVPGPPDPLTGAPTALPKMVPSGPPQSLQARLLQVWGLALKTAGAKLTGDGEALHRVMAWNAHITEHLIEDETRQAAVQQGQLVPAAPGAEEVAGMTPTMGEAQQQEMSGVVQ